jgi:hypothetical protein
MSVNVNSVIVSFVRHSAPFRCGFVILWQILESLLHYVGFEVLTAVVMKFSIFWDIA